jgi:hypothetical protein
MCDVTGGRATAAAIPGAELVIIEGMGHGLPQRLWPELAERIGAMIWQAEASFSDHGGGDAVEPEVRNELVGSRQLASVGATVARQSLGDEIRRLLGIVWAAVRDQHVRAGHNVVVYRGGSGGTLDIVAGVETLSDFVETRDVRRSATPSGEVVWATHYGDYAAMHDAYDAIEVWRRANHRNHAGVGWEVYGDWDEDPAKVRTDVYVLLQSR